MENDTSPQHVEIQAACNDGRFSRAPLQVLCCGKRLCANFLIEEERLNAGVLGADVGRTGLGRNVRELGGSDQDAALGRQTAFSQHEQDHASKRPFRNARPVWRRSASAASLPNPLVASVISIVLDIARPSSIDLVGAHHPLNLSWILAARPSALDHDAAPPPLDGNKSRNYRLSDS